MSLTEEFPNKEMQLTGLSKQSSGYYISQFNRRVYKRDTKPAFKIRRFMRVKYSDYGRKGSFEEPNPRGDTDDIRRR